jgi:hypothetical protein
MEKGEKVMIRTEEPEPLDTIDLSDSSLIDHTEDGEISEAA